MVVHQDSQAVELRQEDIPRGKDASGAVRDVFWRAALQRQGAAPTQQRAVDSPVVRGIIVDQRIIELPQGGRGHQLPHHIGVLHLCEAHRVRYPAEAVGDAEQGLGNGVALAVKAAFGPVLRLVFGAEAEEILDVPERDYQGIARLGECPGRHPEQQKKYNHSPFHIANIAISSDEKKPRSDLRGFFLDLSARKIFRGCP